MAGFGEDSGFLARFWNNSGSSYGRRPWNGNLLPTGFFQPRSVYAAWTDSAKRVSKAAFN